MTTQSIPDQARAIAEATTDAYSYERYLPAEWEGFARRLLENGFHEPAVTWLLRSKLMRWGADMAEDAVYGQHTADHAIEALRRDWTHWRRALTDDRVAGAPASFPEGLA